MARVEDIILDALERIETKLDEVVKGSYTRQLGCLNNFATKASVRKSLWTISILFSTLLLLFAYHPNLVREVVKDLIKIAR